MKDKNITFAEIHYDEFYLSILQNEGRDIGTIRYMLNEEIRKKSEVKLSNSDVIDDFRHKGVGGVLYLFTAIRLAQLGLTLVSDFRLSESALKLWDRLVILELAEKYIDEKGRNRYRFVDLSGVCFNHDVINLSI